MDAASWSSVAAEPVATVLSRIAVETKAKRESEPQLRCLCDVVSSPSSFAAVPEATSSVAIPPLLVDEAAAEMVDPYETTVTVFVPPLQLRAAAVKPSSPSSFATIKPSPTKSPLFMEEPPSSSLSSYARRRPVAAGSSHGSAVAGNRRHRAYCRWIEEEKGEAV